MDTVFPTVRFIFHWVSGIRFRRMRAQSWNLIPRRANRQCQLRSRFTASSTTRYATSTSSSKSSQSIFCARRMLEKSLLPFILPSWQRNVIYNSSFIIACSVLCIFCIKLRTRYHVLDKNTFAFFRFAIIIKSECWKIRKDRKEVDDVEDVSF